MRLVEDYAIASRRRVLEEKWWLLIYSDALNVRDVVSAWIVQGGAAYCCLNTQGCAKVIDCSRVNLQAFPIE